MEAGECFQQLTRRRTCTSLVQAAARRTESMAGQNLRAQEKRTGSELLQEGPLSDHLWRWNECSQLEKGNN